jgi:hypothetical protein
MTDRAPDILDAYDQVDPLPRPDRDDGRVTFGRSQTVRVQGRSTSSLSAPKDGSCGIL